LNHKTLIYLDEINNKIDIMTESNIQYWTKYTTQIVTAIISLAILILLKHFKINLSFLKHLSKA